MCLDGKGGQGCAHSRENPTLFLPHRQMVSLSQEESNGMFREGMGWCAMGMQAAGNRNPGEERRGIKGKSPLSPVRLLECVIQSGWRVLSLTVLVAGNLY